VTSSIKTGQPKKKTRAVGTTAHVATLDAMASRIGQGAKRLTTKERRQQPKLRTGGVDTTRTLATLATRYKVDSTVDVPAMLANVAQLEKLQPLLDSATNLMQIVHDQVLVAAGDSWKSATTIYTMLQRMALDDPRLADELAPVAAKFAKKKAPSGSAGTTKTPVATATASVTPATVTTVAAKQ
jgi:hypothetical protein